MKKWVVIFCSCLVSSVFTQFQNIRVNSDTLNVCNEPSIALNPTNPNNLVIGVNNTYFFSSFDAGESWTEGKLFSSMGVWGDPSLAFDLNGDCFFAHLSGELPISGRWADRIVIQKSTDGGLTWNDGTFTGLNRPKFEDKEWLTIDITSSSYQNNLYTAWTEFDSLFVADSNFKSRELFPRSTDGGETWSTPAIGPEGELYMAWAGPEGILFDRSFDGGVTFGDDIFVSEHVGGWGWGNDIAGIYGNGLPQTICDVSNSSNRGNIYILWADQRNGITNTDIFLIKSTDNGSTLE